MIAVGVGLVLSATAFVLVYKHESRSRSMRRLDMVGTALICAIASATLVGGISLAVEAEAKQTIQGVKVEEN